MNSNLDTTTGEVPFRKFKTNDPQTVVTGKLKQGSKTDIIVFPINLGLIEIIAIANVPLEGAIEAPVYLKWKVNNPNGQAVYSAERPAKTDDPQTIVTGKLKSGDNNDMIIATITVGLLELVCIINIPFKEATEAPVYIKWKVVRPQSV